MHTCKGVFTWLLCCMAWCPYSSGQPHGQPFKAEARVTQAVVKNGKFLPVVTAIRNVSAEEQIFYIWPCNYRGVWTTDNALVHMGGAACLQDAPVIIRLKPDKTYEQELFVYVDLPSDRNRGNLSFRLGYGAKATPFKSQPPLAMPIPNYGSKIYLGTWLPWPYIPPIWSNAVTVTVER
jgi:hypothetical protein